MKTHEQLATLIKLLEQSGWVRLNGNTWQSPGKPYTLRTAYAHQEATLELRHPDNSVRKLGSTAHRYYRGADPVTWAVTEAHPVVAKVFEGTSAKGLDKPADTEEG